MSCNKMWKGTQHERARVRKRYITCTTRQHSGIMRITFLGWEWGYGPGQEYGPGRGTALEEGV